ncbi:MAG: methyl-accepting chemotaxis protein [candidate division WOR-3 bacterium]
MIKFNSLKVQISILLVFIILFINLLTLYSSRFIIKTEFETLIKEKGENLLSSINSIVELSLSSQDTTIFSSTLSEIMKRKDILFLKVYNSFGDIFAKDEKIQIEDTLPRKIMNNVIMGKGFSITREIKKEKFLDCFFPIFSPEREGPLGILRVGISLQESLIATKKLEKTLVKIAFISTIITLVFTIILLNPIFRPLNILRENLKRISYGKVDMNVRISEKFLTAEIKELATSFNEFIKKLQKDKETMHQVAERLSSQAEELSASAEQMAASSEEVSTVMEQIARASEKQAEESQNASLMSQKALTVVRQSLDSAQETLNSSENISDLSAKGKKASEDVRVAMDNVTNTIHELEEVIQGIQRYSEEISGITEKVREISKRTNILSLNATIEATKAGEAGKGFAVVAEEIRKLANQSSEATRIISEIANEISEVINSVIQKTQETIEEVNKGKETSLKSADFLRDIAAEINHITKRIRQIVEVNKRGEEEVNAITEALGNIATIAEENAASSEELSAAIQELSASIEELSTASQETAEIAETLHEITS